MGDGERSGTDPRGRRNSTFLTSSADSEWGFIPLPTRSHTSIVESEDSASEIPEHSAYIYLGMEPTEIGRTAKQIASDDYVPRVTWIQGHRGTEIAPEPSSWPSKSPGNISVKRHNIFFW